MDNEVLTLPCYIHVMGHQLNTGEKLNRWELLNEEMDIRAKDYWEVTKKHKANLTYTTTKSMWPVYIRNVRVIANLRTFIYDAVHGARLGNYWIERKRFPEDSFQLVDWIQISKAMSKCKVSRRRWVTKFVLGVCGTGVNMVRWKQRVSDSCPRCGMVKETTKHVLLCAGAGVQDGWDAQMIDLECWMKKELTCPDIVTIICESMKEWRYGTVGIKRGVSIYEGVNEAEEFQLRIGWGGAIEGCFSHRWTSAQCSYYKWLGSMKTGEKWMNTLIRLVWDLDLTD